jgi:hypothetical protein
MLISICFSCLMQLTSAHTRGNNFIWHLQLELSQYSVWLRPGRPGDRGSIPGRGERIFPLASVSRPALEPTQPPVQWLPGVLYPGVKRGRGLTLTTHPHLVPWSWMSRSYTSSLPSVSMACSGAALYSYNSVDSAVFLKRMPIVVSQPIQNAMLLRNQVYSQRFWKEKLVIASYPQAVQYVPYLHNPFL